MDPQSPQIGSGSAVHQQKQQHQQQLHRIQLERQYQSTPLPPIPPLSSQDHHSHHHRQLNSSSDTRQSVPKKDSHHFQPTDHDTSLLYAHQTQASSATSSNSTVSTSASAPGGHGHHSQHSSSSNSLRSLPFLKNHHHHQQQQQHHQQQQHQQQSHHNSSVHSSSGSNHTHSSSTSKHTKAQHSKGDSGNYDPPSIQQAIHSIPSMLLQQQKTNSESNGTMGEHILLQEWLQKRSTSLQLVWKRRWCVLRDDRLFFYRSNVSMLLATLWPSHSSLSFHLLTCTCMSLDRQQALGCPPPC